MVICILYTYLLIVSVLILVLVESLEIRDLCSVRDRERRDNGEMFRSIWLSHRQMKMFRVRFRFKNGFRFEKGCVTLGTRSDTDST